MSYGRTMMNVAWLGLAFLMLAGCASPSAAPSPAADAGEREDPDLGVRISVDFKQTSLDNAIKMIGKAAKIDIDPDWPGLISINYVRDGLLTLRLDRVPVRQVIWAIFLRSEVQGYNSVPAVVAQAGRVRIAPRDTLFLSTRTMRHYNLSDFILEADAEGGENSQTEGHPGDEVEKSIIESIETMVGDKEDWPDFGGVLRRVTPWFDGLIISCGPEYHGQIARLLAAMRKPDPARDIFWDNEPGLTRLMDRPFSMSFKDRPMSQVLPELSEALGWRIVVDSSVPEGWLNRRVSLAPGTRTWRQAAKALLHGPVNPDGGEIGFVQVGSVVRVGVLSQYLPTRVYPVPARFLAGDEDSQDALRRILQMIESRFGRKEDWPDFGGTRYSICWITDRLLIVRTTPEIHEQIFRMMWPPRGRSLKPGPIDSGGELVK